MKEEQCDDNGDETETADYTSSYKDPDTLYISLRADPRMRDLVLRRVRGEPPCPPDR